MKTREVTLRDLVDIVDDADRKKVSKASRKALRAFAAVALERMTSGLPAERRRSGKVKL